MKTFSAVALLALPLGALGLSITSPGTNDTWDSSGSHTITWQTVSTDPTSFSILLTNFGVYPPQVLNVVANQQASAGTFTFSAFLPVGDDYRIRFNSINTNQNTGILAESGQFQIVSGGPDPQVSVSVIGGTSTVLLGTPTASTKAATTNNQLDASATSKGASATGTAASAGTTGSGSGSGSGAGAGADAGSSSTAADASGSAAKSTGTATGTSSGHATYGSRGFAIALAMIGVGFAAMFVVA